MENRWKQIGWDRKSLTLDGTVGQEVVARKQKMPQLKERKKGAASNHCCIAALWCIQGPWRNVCV